MLNMHFYKLNNAILIFSEPRGGSTWLMEILDSLPKTIINWEPLHIEQGIVTDKLYLGNFPYIDSNHNSIRYMNLFKKMLTFQTHNIWTTKFVKLRLIWESKYVITKFVRGNQLLPWITTVFRNQFNHRPIYLLRHPISTSMSQLKTFKGLNKKEALKEMNQKLSFSIPQTLNNKRFIKHKNYLTSLNTRLERQIAIWCINNACLIEQNSKKDWIVVYYETLVSEPLKESTRIINELSLGVPTNIFESFNFKNPSYTTNHNNTINDTHIQLESIIESLDVIFLERIQKIFDKFGLKIYEANNPYPIN